MWKYNAGNLTAQRTNADGSCESRLASALTAGELAACLPADLPAAQQQRDAIQAQIDALEQKEILPRSTRIFMLTVAIGLAAQQGVTEPQLYASNYEYKKIKDFEATITALRMQMLAIV